MLSVCRPGQPESVQIGRLLKNWQPCTILMHVETNEGTGRMKKRGVRRAPLTRSEVMSRIRSRDTLPELVVRKAAHALGFRFRLHRRDLPGVPDLVFPRFQSVIFVHGCFWHQHAASSCAAGHMPKSNLGYWGPKLERNVQRDAENVKRLKALGWRVLILWECQLANAAALQRRITRFLQAA